MSATTALVAERPRCRERPTIAGAARVGALLATHPGTWTGTDLKLAISWLRCRGSCTEVKVGAGYRVRTRDRGYRIRISVLASNSLGSASALSKPTAAAR